MRCESCGHENDAETASCARCGAHAALGPPAPPATGAPASAVLGAPARAGWVLGDESTTERLVDGQAPTGARPRADISRAQVGRAAAAPRYAGFLMRLIAFAIDGAVLGIFTLPLALAGLAGVRLGLLVLGKPVPAETADSAEPLLTLGWLAMALVYFTALHAGAGQTIGKAALGIAVRRAADLSRIGPVRSVVRALGYLASSSFLGVGFILVALTPQKRGWHDYLAGTCVVRLASDEA